MSTSCIYLVVWETSPSSPRYDARKPFILQAACIGLMQAQSVAGGESDMHVRVMECGLITIATGGPTRFAELPGKAVRR